MNLAELEVSGKPGWRGINRLELHQATVTVTIEGYDRTVTG